MLVRFLIQTLVIFPGLNFILGLKRFSIQKRLYLVIGAVALIAAAEMVLIAQEWEHNYFQILGVPRSASVQDIKQAYRQVSKDLHPDKNPAPEAKELYLLAGQAHNILINDESREAYDRWGTRGLKWVEHDQSVEQHGFIETATFLLSQVVLVYILTTSVSSTNARSYSYGYLGFTLVLIVGMRFGEDDLPLPLFPYLTKDQKCELLGSVVPMVVLAICAIQRHMYFDMEEHLVESLRRIEVVQRAILTKTGTIPKARSQQEQVEVDVQARKRFDIPDIPSWAYVLVFMAASSYFGRD